MKPIRAVGPLALALAGLSIVAGCASPIGQAGSGWPAAQSAVPTSATAPVGSAAPSSVGSTNPADAATYAQIETEVQATRGLKATSTVHPVLLDSAGVASFLSKVNATETDHDALAKESRLLIDMGMLPAGSSLEQLELGLESSQVIGFYDPKSKGLYVLSESGGVGGAEKITFAHEYTHALQDQNFGLAKLQTDAPDQSDRDLARLSLPEGDATLSMTQWATKYMTPAEILSVANDPGSVDQLKQFQAAPPILRETLEFPYQQGLAFVQGIYEEGGWAAVDKVYANPPDSTSQILHPEQYTKGVKPVSVVVPDLTSAQAKAGWSPTTQDTFGEFQLGVWLAGADERNAGWGDAVTEWAGDRVGLYEGPNGAWAVVMNTAWRSAAGQERFDTAARTLLAQMTAASRSCATAGGAGYAAGEVIVLASDATTLSQFTFC